jgi:iron complex outermembrane receptor protein
MKNVKPFPRFGVCLSILLALFLCAFPSPLAAQQASGAINGDVADTAGGVIRGASVSVTNESTKQVTNTTTDGQGHFSISGLAAGLYTVDVAAPSFAAVTRTSVQVGASQPQNVSLTLQLASVSQMVVVSSDDSSSEAAHLSPMDALLDEHSARTEIKPVFIQNFTNPESDFGELVQMAPGTFSITSNGIGLAQDKTYFRGFPDGDYDIDFDGIPFYDTNTPTHHTWAFFPSPWVGGVDFDRSPGSASTIGPTPFGGSIHLLSPEMTDQPIANVGVSYGSWNTILVDGNFDSGNFLGKKDNMLIDVQHMQSDGYQTNNFQDRNAGDLKYVHKFSDANVLTGYSGVVWLDSNTPNNNATRAQLQTYGDNFLLTNSCTSAATCTDPLYYKFYTYHVPTDVEYVGWQKQFSHGWQTDLKGYTLSYYNAQYYDNPSFSNTGTGAGLTPSAISTVSAVDKLNSYRKYGETFTASQVSQWGILRAGLWYEWAATNRFQTPSNPQTRVDATLPNFHERFWTNSAQPFAEYELHATHKLTVTGGLKYAYFNQSLTQYQDNGKTVGCLGGTLVGNPKTSPTVSCNGGAPSTSHSAGYSSYLPSFDANYRFTGFWSGYAQFSKGTIVPPSSVFDVTGANTVLTPKPTGVTTYQIGSVVKLARATLNFDAYRIRYQNTYSQITDPDNQTAFDFVAAGDALAKGIEGEGNFLITHGLSLYINGTAGNAKYVSGEIPGATGAIAANLNYGKWVANTPSNTETFGLTYQERHFELGVFDKRVGDMWNDLTLANKTTANQIVPIAPFSLTNVYLNYTLGGNSMFAQSKLRFTVNNLFDNHNIVSDTQAANSFSSITTAVYQAGPADIIQVLPARSYTVTFTMGLSPRR